MATLVHSFIITRLHYSIATLSHYYTIPLLRYCTATLSHYFNTTLIRFYTTMQGTLVHYSLISLYKNTLKHQNCSPAKAELFTPSFDWAAEKKEKRNCKIRACSRTIIKLGHKLGPGNTRKESSVDFGVVSVLGRLRLRSRNNLVFLRKNFSFLDFLSVSVNFGSPY